MCIGRTSLYRSSAERSQVFQSVGKHTGGNSCWSLAESAYYWGIMSVVDQSLRKDRTLNMFERLARVTIYFTGKMTLRHFVGVA